MLPVLLAWAALGETGEVLRRIADAQEKSAEARRLIVYPQEIRAKLIRGNGKPAREERYVYDVIPTPEGTTKKLVAFEGRWEDNGRHGTSDAPGFERKELNVDADLIADIVKDLVNDSNSRDGFDRHLFPLTREEQVKYDFQMEGNRLKFQPRRRESAWRGETLLGENGHPLSVTTSLARKIPMWVRVTLGTNFQQVGFAASYRNIDFRRATAGSSIQFER